MLTTRHGVRPLSAADLDAFLELTGRDPVVNVFVDHRARTTNLEPRWLGPHIGYTLAKYGMSLCALGFAAELEEAGVASNALWPRTIIATAAVQNLLGGDEAMARARKPELYADAAYAVVTRPSRECTGNTYLCEDVLA